MNFVMSAASIIDVEHWLMKYLAYGAFKDPGRMSALRNVLMIHLDKEKGLIDKARRCAEAEGLILDFVNNLDPIRDSTTPHKVLLSIILHEEHVDSLLRRIKAHLNNKLRILSGATQ